MRATNPRLLTATFVLVCASACDYSRDQVAPSCYGEVAQAGSAATSNMRAVSDPSTTGTSNPMSAAATGGAAAVSGSAGKAPTTGVADSGSTAAPTQGSTTTPATAASDSGAASCDMTGKWLMSMHRTTDGLGNLQTLHDWIYYEIAQQGDSFRVTKSLKCGNDVVGGGAFAITMDYTKAAPGVMMHVNHDGRTGTSVSGASGCEVSFDKQYTVVGATLPYYLDPSTTLPNADQMSTNGMPGWEDWDEDGKPGITGICNGTIMGEVYTASRDWHTLTASVPDVSSMFRLEIDWDQEPNVMSFEGSPFLGSTAIRAADPKLHFVEMARLTAEQANSDDTTLCKRVVALAPMLTPAANASVM